MRIYAHTGTIIGRVRPPATVLMTVVLLLTVLWTSTGPAAAQATSADLDISGTASPNPVEAGRSLTYSYDVSNAGPDDATNVVFEDTLPAGVEFVGATVNGLESCTAAGGVVTCDLGDLFALDFATNVEIVVRPTQAGTIENVARVRGAVADPNPANDESRISTQVEPAVPGAIAGAVTRQEAFVTGADYVTVPPEGTPNRVSNAPLAGFPTHGTNYGILTTGDATQAGEPNESGSSGANNGGDNVRGDNDFDVSILKVDLAVPAGSSCLSMDFKFLSEEFPEFVGQGVNDAFIAELDNSNWTTSMADGTLSAPNNFVFDQLGKPISIDSTGPTSVSEADAAGTTYDAATRILTAKTPITPGAHSLFLSIFDQGDRVYDSAAFVDNVNLTSESGATCQSGVQLPTADLSISMSDNPDPVGVGGQLTYTLRATNDGPDPATNVTIEDTLPANVELISANASQGACGGTATVTCEVGNLASGASAAATVVVRPTANAVPGISNTGTVRGGEADPNDANNSATASTTVNAAQDPDTAPPDTSITGGPSGLVNSSSATFSFSSEAGATFQCSLDGGAFTACSSPKAYTGLSEGQHTFEVRATDAAGNVDSTPASRTWTVDTAAPSGTVSINGGATYATSLSVKLALSANGAESMRLMNDGGNWSDWQPYAAEMSWTLRNANGARTVHVEYRDEAGNVSAASDGITLDTVAPRVTKTSPVAGARNILPGANVTATFSEPMNPATITRTSIILRRDFGRGVYRPVTATVTYNPSSRTATLNPTGNLVAGATYVATVFQSTRDTAGNQLDQYPGLPQNNGLFWRFVIRR